MVSVVIKMGVAVRPVCVKRWATIFIVYKDTDESNYRLGASDIAALHSGVQLGSKGSPNSLMTSIPLTSIWGPVMGRVRAR
jgi:hypothetical protein